MSATRTEHDSMGAMEVPADALYGATTQRAVLNFPISGYRFTREFIRALGLVKWAAAKANLELGKLDATRAELIAQAAGEIIEGKHDAHFPIDIFQTGSGTSTNMNANEVIANRCSQLAGKPIGSKDPVHPNDHVNMGQSSNDVIPTAIHVAAGERIRKYLMPALEALEVALEHKAKEFWEIIKIGRTHLMDATPVRLGQEFGGYAKQITHARLRAGNAIAAIEELPLGGTAVGTGLNCHPDFPGEGDPSSARPHRHQFPRSPRPLRGAGRQGRPRAGQRPAQDHRRQPFQNRQRHPLARQRPALRHRRNPAARDPARQLDHARQGQPRDERGAHAGLRAGHRQRRDHHLGRRATETSS